MAPAGLFPRRVQARNCTRNDISDLPRTGSWTACILATIAASALIFSAGAQNVAHGYQIGLASSEFRALVLAAASAGASVLGPFCWVAVVRGRGFGTRTIALVLALGCLAYASVCSLGFVAGSRDTAISERVVAAETHQDRRALAKAARDELATLKGQRADIVERRAELTALLAKLSDAAPDKRTAARPDAQAAGVAFALGALGWRATEADVGQWLNIGTVLFLELAAALSLTVAAGLYPATQQIAFRSPPAATLPSPTPDTAETPEATVRPPKRAVAALPDERDDEPPPPPPKSRGKAGRKPTVLPQQALDRIRAKGGKMSGSINGVGKMLGARSKTTAHRLLHRMASAGMIRLASGPHGVSIAVA